MDLIEHLWDHYLAAVHHDVESDYKDVTIIRVGKEVIDMDVKDRLEKGGVFAFLSFAKKYLQGFDVTISVKQTKGGPRADP